MGGGIALDGHADDFAGTSFAFGFHFIFVAHDDGAGLVGEFAIESFEELFGGLFAIEFADAVELFLFFADHAIEFDFAGIELASAVGVFLLGGLKHLFFFAEGFLLFFELCEFAIEFAFAVSQLILAFGDFGIEGFAVFEEVFLELEFLVTAEIVCFAAGLEEDIVAGFPRLASDEPIEEVADSRADDPGQKADDQVIHGQFPEA